MARPNKDGLEYFPLDTRFDEEVLLIDAKFGCTGIGILVKLWQIIYLNGYYVNWTERESLLYRSKINSSEEDLNNVIDECLKWGIFNKKLYEKYTILTSSGVQKRFLEATKRRKIVTFIIEYSCLDSLELVNDNIIVVNVDNNSPEPSKCIPDVDSGTQTETDTETDTETKKEKKLKYGEFENVKLSNIELEKLKEKFSDYQEKIESLSGYIKSKGIKYKDHYATILNWARKEEKEKPKIKEGNNDENSIYDYDKLFE